MNSFVLLSSAAFGLPVVQAKASESKTSEELTNKVKPSSLPLYPESEKLEYTLQPPTQVEVYVRDARTQAAKIKQEYQPALDSVCHVVSTGRAHTNEAITRLRDEDNLVGRIGFMAVGGLLGLITARKGRFLKKITYLSVGLAGTGSICYPKEAKVYSTEVGNLAVKNARIAYHFVVGTRPTIQNENGKAFEKMSGMVSDVWQWGFRLFDKKQPEVKVVEDAKTEEPLVIESEEVPSEDNRAVSPSSEQDQTNKHTEEAAAEIEPSVDKTLGTPSQIPASEPSLTAESVRETEPRSTNETPSASNAKSALQLEGDPGQGNPEDKELYTTRE